MRRPKGCRPAQCFQCGRFKSRPSSRCDYCGDEPGTHNMTERERIDFDRAHGFD